MTTAPDSYRLGYRADVEGLRAVAILLVVACHAKVPWLAGGFVGVDVFYVLSGYLITGLLVQEVATTGDLRFANFYGRRLRRLLPALLLMLAVTAVLARLLSPPAGMSGQATAAAGAALWLSNFHFAFWNLGYFQPEAESNLFLHTWSLGVEEQFYVAWPLLVVLAMGAWKGAKHPPNPARLKWLFGGIFVLSLALSLYWTRHAPHLAFYMMPSRAWQFALGALVFLLVGSPGFRLHAGIARSRWAQPAGWVGLGMVLVTALLIDGGVPYPGSWAMAPTFGAALVLAAGAGPAPAGVARVLSLRPLQSLGRVSYAWYLWHWPILLLGEQLPWLHNDRGRLALVASSLLVAMASYHWFETPVRRARWLLARPRIAVSAGVVVIALAAAVAMGWNGAARKRMHDPALQPFEAARNDAPMIYRMGCDDWYHSARVRVCEFGDPHARHTAVALGDSVALQWFPAYREIFTRPGWRLLVITKSACPMVDAPFLYTRIGRDYTECGEWRDAALRKLAVLHPEVVVLGSEFTYPFTQRQWVAGTRAVLARVTANAGRVYLMRSTPTLPFNGPDCSEPRSHLYDVLAGAARCSAPIHDARFDAVDRWIHEAAAPFDNVRLIDLTPSVCPDHECRAERHGRVVFRDTQHLTAGFARSLAPALAAALGPAATDAVATRATTNPPVSAKPAARPRAR